MMHKSEIPTPALLIDLDAMEANIARMAQFFQQTPTRLRPHFKTHKCPELAQKQMQAGAIGMTCAKLGEAEVLVNAGIPSILIANEIVDERKITRVAQLALRTQIIVAVDQEENVRMYSGAAQQAGSEISLVVEVNVGHQRCGVLPGEPALRLARLIDDLPGLRFAGVLGYEGHAVLDANQESRSQKASLAMSELARAAEAIRQAGIEVGIVSGGGTGTYNISGIHPGVTEIEAGSYIFMDTKYRLLNLPFRNALTLLATVISVPTPQRAIIDAGMKAITHENGLPEVVARPGVRLKALHEEHGILDVDETQAAMRPGDRVELWPSHVCTTVNLHDQYYALRGEEVEAIWSISGRGKFQ